MLIPNGHVYLDVMQREKLTQSQLEAAMRQVGCASAADVHFAILENNGKISVHLKNHAS